MKQGMRFGIIFLVISLTSCAPKQSSDYSLIRNNSKLTDFAESDLSYLDALQKNQTTRAQNKKGEQEKRLQSLLAELERREFDEKIDKHSRIRYTPNTAPGLIHLGIKYNNKGFNLIDVWK